MTAGRPNLPISVKIARGTYQPCRDAGRETGYTVAPLEDEDPPAWLGKRGRDMWVTLASAGYWLAETDYLALAVACKLADLAARAESRYHADPDPENARILLNILNAFIAQLGRLGFDPSARSRLGIAEITARSKLAQMMRRAR